MGVRKVQLLMSVIAIELLLGGNSVRNIKEQKRMELSISLRKRFHGHIIPIV